MSKPAATKSKNLVLRLGPSTGWLPAVAVFLCLAMFGMAALALHGVASDPQSPQSASVTAISAQGFQGLRRLLDGRGITTLTNRFEDGPSVTRGDLEIITLDVQPSLGLFVAAQSHSADSASAEAEAPASGVAEAPLTDKASVEGNDASGAAPETPPVTQAETQVGSGFVPKKAQADHILNNPLGRAVLIVAPKWRASYYAGHPRWAGEAKPIEEGELLDALTVLSPMRDVETTSNDDTYTAPELGPDEDWYPEPERTTIYHRLDYKIARGTWDLAPVAIKAPDGSVVGTGKVAQLQSITGSNLTPVLTGPAGEVLLARVTVPGAKPGAAPVYLLSDPDLLNNQILNEPGRVMAALNIIDRVMPPTANSPSVVFNLTFNGMTFDHDLLHAMSRPPYLAIPLSLLILGIGLMWAAFARFGPARQVVSEAALGRGVRVLADNAARLMSLTLRETKLAPSYAVLMRDMVLKGRGYMTAQSASEPLDALADRIGSLCNTTHSFAALRQEAGQVLTVHQLIDLTRKLHAWKTEIQRAHI